MKKGDRISTPLGYGYVRNISKRDGIVSVMLLEIQSTPIAFDLYELLSMNESFEDDADIIADNYYSL